MKKVFDLITKRWIELPFETDPKKEESVVLSDEQWEALGLNKGMKTKPFSEMTEEEQKLFTDNDSDEGSEVDN